MRKLFPEPLPKRPKADGFGEVSREKLPRRSFEAGVAYF